jgi:hypothetical protein
MYLNKKYIYYVFKLGATDTSLKIEGLKFAFYFGSKLFSYVMTATTIPLNYPDTIPLC